MRAAKPSSAKSRASSGASRNTSATVAASRFFERSSFDAAAWSAQRTLLLVLNRTDGKDEALIDETCRILLQHEELRYTRIQLNPPADSAQAVRWRLWAPSAEYVELVLLDNFPVWQTQIAVQRRDSRAPGTRLYEGTLAVGESITFSCGD